MTCSLFISFFWDNILPIATSIIKIYKWNGHEGLGGIKIEGYIRYFLIWSKAYW